MLCLPEWKEFSWEHQSEENRKSELRVGVQLPGGPGVSRAGGAPRLLGGHTWAEVRVFRGCIEGGMVPVALGQGRCRGPGVDAVLAGCGRLSTAELPGPCMALGDPRTASLGLEKVNMDSFGVNNFREMCSLKG